MEEGGQPHKRRVRYSGTHPKSFREKYKELDPEKYPEIIAKIRAKRNTPAGMHIPILVKEILEFLKIEPGQTGLDATLGYGGHTLEILKCLNHRGHLYATDVDAVESAKAKKRLNALGYGEEILSVYNINFADIDQITAESGLFDFALADLGVSSMQLDDPERGFTFKRDGPLDLRLNPAKGIPAGERLKNISQEKLQLMLVENADEPYAEQISRAITARLRRGEGIETTSQLREAVAGALRFLPAHTRDDSIKKSARRTFQALRIDVNKEFEALSAFMEKLPHCMAKGGRIAILTFHSGEDRIVKQSFKELFREGVYREVARDVIRPSAGECDLNSRARSAKMRWAVKA